MKKIFCFCIGTLLQIPLMAQLRVLENNTKSVTITPESFTIKTGNSNNFEANVSLGYDALKSNQANVQVGEGNVAIGFQSLRDNTANLNGTLPYGIFNTAVGYGSMQSNRGGNWNTAIGTYTLVFGTQTKNNTILGYGAANQVLSNENVAIGSNAMTSGYYGNRNTIIGTRAGETFGSIGNGDDSSNVFIGYNAGSISGQRSNKLFISNTNTQNPLIWGDFYDKKLGFHGKVGIGTKAPIDQLHIHDSDTSIPQSYMRFTNGFSDQNATDGFRIGLSEFMMGVVWHFENKPIVFGTNNTTRMTIHENGRVGLGTSNPQTNLHIYQNEGVSGLLLNNSYNGTGFLDGLFLGSGQSSSSLINRENNILFIGTNNTNIATFHPDGKLGIGLNGLPANSDLHIHKNAFENSEIRLTNISTGYDPTDGFTITMKNGGELEMNYKENQKVVFQTNSSATPELVLQTNGNLGLGVNNASAKLEVNGFTKLGSDAPSIKIKKLTTTTGSNDAAGNLTTIPTGVTATKIIGIQVLVEYGPGQYVPSSYTKNGGYEFNFATNNLNEIEIWNISGNSYNIYSKPIKIIITYEE